MERSENLTPEPICNENTSDFLKMAGDGGQEMGTVTVTETDTVTDDLDRDTGIPTTMLTPPPTSEPLLLNGSSRSSTTGSDLQQFTGDGDDEMQIPSSSPLLSASSPSSSSSLPPPSSAHVDDGHSNHSTNSDSIDSKSLIINEGPEDSADNVSSEADRKIVDDNANDTGSAAIATAQDDGESEEDDGGEEQQQQQNIDDATSEAAAAATEALYDDCSRPQTDECDTNSEDKMISAESITADQVITNEVDVDVDDDNDYDVIPDGDDSRQRIKSTTSLDEMEVGSDVDANTEQACAGAVDDETVPCQSINGISEQSPSSSPASAAAEIEHHEQSSLVASQTDAHDADEPDNCLANELHITDYKKLKRKLSTNSADDSYETLKKQTKYDQTETTASSLDSNEIDNVNDNDNDNDSNQVDVVADLISNHVNEHNQIPVRCDSSLSTTDIQNASDDSPSIADETLSIEHIPADQVIPNDDANVDADAGAGASANVDGVDVNVDVDVDDIDVLPATKDTIHDDDTHEHKYMNGHINNQMECVPLADNANEESKEAAAAVGPPPQQQYKQQPAITYSMVEETNESEFASKIAPSSPSLSFLSSSSSSLSQSQSQSQSQSHQNDPNHDDDDEDDDDDDEEDNLVINDVNNFNSDTDPAFNKMESNHSTDQYRIETEATAELQRPADITDTLNCNLNMIATSKSVDVMVDSSSTVDSTNCLNANDFRNATPSPQSPPLPQPPPPPPPPPPSQSPHLPLHNRNRSLNLQNKRSIKSIDNRLAQQQSQNQLTEYNRRNAATTTASAAMVAAATAQQRARRQVFLCSTCGTYHEKWNLFCHLREVHNKFICLYENCLGIFSSAGKLVAHLEAKHVRRPHIYDHCDDLLRKVHNQCFLMCCDCEHIFTEMDGNDVTAHVCETFKRPCLVCGLKSHKSNCSALHSRKAIKSMKSKRSTMIEPTIPISQSMVMSMPAHPQPQPHLHPHPQLQSQPPAPLIQINANQHQNLHPNHMAQQQTFLRNALMGQESRLNQHSQSGIAAPAPMLVGLPIPPHSAQVTMPMPHQHHQPYQQFSAPPYPVTSFNGNIVQTPSVPKLFMNPTTPTMLDTQSKFYNPNQLQTTNANVYNVMYNAPYQNLSNGQYTQNHFETRYSTPNAMLQSTSTMASMTTTPTPMTYQHHQQQQHQQQQQQQQQRFQDMAAKMQTYDESSESPKKSVRFVGSNNSNSGNSSSNSDDSNNDSDSSSNDSDVEKDDKQNQKKMLVKPLRINLNSNKNVSNEHGASSAYMNIAPQNDSANEDEAIDDEPAASNTANASKYHANSDITNIQMQLDDIQQQMNAMQKTSTSQQKDGGGGDDQQQMKVPKLKLKLSKPFEKPDESEQSSTESDSGSDNENDDEENDNAMMSGMSTEMNSNDLNQHHQALAFNHQSNDQKLQQQQHEQHPYDANNSFLDASNRFAAENANESGLSAKNTSTESLDDQITQHPDVQYPAHFENDTSAQIPSDQLLPLEQHELHPDDESATSNADITGQTNLAADTNIVASLSDTYNSTFEPSEPSTMAQSDHGTLDGQSDAQINGNGQTQSAPIGEMIDSVKSAAVAADYQPPSEHESLDIMDIPPVIQEDTRPIIEFILDQPLDKIPITDFIRTCLQYTYPSCLYCNHARSIAVDGVSLAEHMISDHRFSATVDSITAEELLPETIEHKISTGIDELHGTHFNMSTYDSKNFDDNYRFVKHFECFQCRFSSHIYKDLYLHNRKMHLRSALICLMCRSNFYSYSELVCHMCPGAPSKLIPIDLKFRCVLCNLDAIPSAFRLMVHIRKKHSACDVCLDECYDQSKLSSHVWKHKLHHLCYRCNMTYRNKADITRHLFWKHGTESVMCKRCLEKKWPHVYHFCVPPTSFKCESCAQSFSKAITLKVHKRMHDPNAIAFACTLEFCDEKFISKKLMIKHVSLHYMPELPPPSEEKELLLHRQDAGDGDLIKDQSGDNIPEINSPAHCSNLNSPKAIIEQEAPIDAVISVIEHDARERQEQEKLLKKESSARNGSATDTPNSKSKSKKLKRNRSDFSDLLPDLPSLNLSESDSSSDGSDLDDPSAENSRHSIAIDAPAPSAADETAELATDVAAPSTTSNLKPKQNNATPLDDDDENKAIPLEADIWENFKMYQANQMLDKAQEDVEEDRLVAESVPILLHVSQSDHDYPMMYKPVTKRSKATAVAEHHPYVAIPIIEESEKGDIKITFTETIDTAENINNMDPQSPAPLPASTVTIANDDTGGASTANENESPSKAKADSDSSSDSSGSDSDSSSCSCGSNCSCTSSSSSSSSSSGSGSDSSNNSESKRKQRQKVLTKTRKSPGRTTPERRTSADENEVPKADHLNGSPKRESGTSELTTAATAADSQQEQQPASLQPSSSSPPPNVDGDEEKDSLAQPMHDESENVDVEKPSDIELVDVVTTDKKPNPPNVYTMIVESDLETTEPDTDEEFYDEHPQKLAIQMLAEKRQQLMLQTLNPVNGMPYMSSTSRPATPLLPEDLATKASKGGRTKKRRRTCKNARSPQKQAAAAAAAAAAANNALRINQMRVPQPEFHPIVGQKPMETMILPNEMPIDRIDTNQQANFDANASVSAANFHLTSSESPTVRSQSQIHSFSIRLSTSSCSDADSSLKRSKRRRIPNRFYGYTSDDESMSATSVLNTGYSQNPFKPTPPPNLTWSKDDLPKSKPAKGNRIGGNAAAAASATAGKKVMRLPKQAAAGKVPKQRKLQLKATAKAGSMKNRTLSKFKEKMRMAAAMPTVPKIIIRGIPRPPQPTKPLHHMPSYAAPDLSNASRIPNAPVHHMSPPSSKFSDDQSNQSSDSESDSNLHISQSFRSNFGSMSKAGTGKNERFQQHQQQQQQHHHHHQQQMPFIRPDHTLLPLKPKSYSPSLSPSPPPPSASSAAAMLSTPAALGHPNQSSSSSSLQQQPAMFNGSAQYRSTKQESSRNDSSLYCYCRRPYDELEGEMIACDAQDCAIEWFHMSCVGLKVAPEGDWFCPQCQTRNQHPANFTNATSALQNTNSLYSMSHPLPPQSFDLA